ncbi:MAG: alpha/beta hydrolase [Chloroflexi bacterium]|nr:alpha/beta hydrolase [Chloroflexota bacterium]
MPFATVDGKQVYYVQQGAQGLPVVFVHGSGASHLIWWPHVRALADLARPVALDLPGHGKSEGPGRVTVDAYCDVLLDFLDALAFDRALIVGHSLGGAIAQTFAVTHPDRTAALGLVGTGARLRVLPAILEGIVSPSDFDETVRLIVENTYAADNLDAATRRRAEEDLRACPPQVARGDFAACNGFDIMPRLGEIHAPTLIVCGSEDKMTPVKYSEFLASKIPNSRLVVVERAGHSVMIEQAAELGQALAGFVRELRESRE